MIYICTVSSIRIRYNMAYRLQVFMSACEHTLQNNNVHAQTSHAHNFKHARTPTQVRQKTETHAEHICMCTHTNRTEASIHIFARIRTTYIPPAGSRVPGKCGGILNQFRRKKGCINPPRLSAGRGEKTVCRSSSYLTTLRTRTCRLNPPSSIPHKQTV